MGLDVEHSKNYAEAFRRALDLYVGNGRPYTVEALSEVTGISSNTLYEYKNGNLKPSFCAVMELIRVLPASFTNMVLAPTGLSGATKPEDNHGDVGKLHAVVCQLSHSIAQKRSDGRVDHIEDAELRAELPRLIEVAGGYLASNCVSLDKARAG